MFTIILFFLSIFTLINSYDCPRRCVCNSLPTHVTCDEANNPMFDRDPTVKSVLMRNGYLRDVLLIMQSFPNLEYLTFVDMKYLNCEEINQIPDRIIISQDSCYVSTTTTTTTTTTEKGKVYILLFISSNKTIKYI